MKEPCCATCRVGSINCDGNGWYLFKNSPTCCWITSTASSTTAAPRYALEWWKPSTATSKPFFEGVVATRISAICCSKLSAWRSPRPNSSFFRKPPKMRASTNSCAEPKRQNLRLSRYVQVLNHVVWLAKSHAPGQRPFGIVPRERYLARLPKQRRYSNDPETLQRLHPASAGRGKNALINVAEVISVLQEQTFTGPSRSRPLFR